jgi:hypothetical protein
MIRWEDFHMVKGLAWLCMYVCGWSEVEYEVVGAENLLALA